MSDNTHAWLDLQRWYRSAEGMRCAAVERKALSKVLSSLFGMCIITLGVPAEGMVTGDSFVRHYQLDLAPAQYSMIDVLSQPAQLPLANESVDVVVVPHTLEFSTRPQAVLDEVKRVLKADGHIAIVTFNALSLLSFWRWLKARRGKDGRYKAFAYIRHSNVISLCYSLNRLDFDTLSVEYLRYFSDAWRWPGSHGVVVLARKRVIPMTIIRPKWRSQLRADNSLAGPV